jgi:hypothetical protein
VNSIRADNFQQIRWQHTFSQKDTKEVAHNSHLRDNSILKIIKCILFNRRIQLVAPPARCRLTMFKSLHGSQQQIRDREQAPHLSLQLFPVLPGMPEAMTDQLRGPYMPTRRVSISSSCTEIDSSDNLERDIYSAR